MGAGIDVTFNIPPQWEEIDHVRTDLTSRLLAAGYVREAVDAVAMAACELTENAVKYGTFANPNAAITVHLMTAPREITVEVIHPVAGEDDASLRRLDEMIQWIRGFQDPFEAYIERLRHVSAQDLAYHESGLGLVRIAYEGQSTLDFYVNDKNLLAVSAMHRF